MYSEGLISLDTEHTQLNTFKLNNVPLLSLWHSFKFYMLKVSEYDELHFCILDYKHYEIVNIISLMCLKCQT